jgi:hypothetical protein
MIAQKIKILISFTSQINIKWIKASHVDMNLFHKKNIKYKKFGNLLVYLSLPRWLEKNAYSTITFYKDLVKKINIPAKLVYSCIFKKLFKKSQCKLTSWNLPKLLIVLCKDFGLMGLSLLLLQVQRSPYEVFIWRGPKPVAKTFKACDWPKLGSFLKLALF